MVINELQHKKTYIYYELFQQEYMGNPRIKLGSQLESIQVNDRPIFLNCFVSLSQLQRRNPEECG